MSYKDVSNHLHYGKKLVSLISYMTDNDSSNRTYTIIPGEPQEKLHTKDFVLKYIHDTKNKLNSIFTANDY
jgi:hypothetical protein